LKIYFSKASICNQQKHYTFPFEKFQGRKGGNFILFVEKRWKESGCPPYPVKQYAKRNRYNYKKFAICSQEDMQKSLHHQCA
jgi:hypothetical protein